MVIDSSALIALLLSEPETAESVTAIAGSLVRLISAASYLETTIVMLSRSGSEGQRKLDRLLTDLAATVFPFTLDQAVLAAEAYKRYGKGSGHPAGLNFGDCFTYGLAKLTGEPVLFKGNDFSRTDLASAVSQPQR
jgi:ribonuclease VapC